MSNKPETLTIERQIMLLRPTHSALILQLLHGSWPDEIELLKANFTAQGVSAQIRFRDQVYVLEIRPDE